VESAGAARCGTRARLGATPDVHDLDGDEMEVVAELDRVWAAWAPPPRRPVDYCQRWRWRPPIKIRVQRGILVDDRRGVQGSGKRQCCGAVVRAPPQPWVADGRWTESKMAEVAGAVT
jgi:hypothetical protein